MSGCQRWVKKNFASLAKAALLSTTAATPVPLEIWFQDEARVGQQGTHAYIWAPVGSRPLMVRDNRHDSAYLFGAICPDRGVGAAMITPHANTEAMNLHLGEVSTQVTAGARALLLCDGAGWHQRGRQLVVPDNITMLTLPAYSPELNPMENVWDYLRQNKLRPLTDILDKHHATLVNQFDAFASYVVEAEEEGPENFPLYKWTKAIVEDPAKRAKHIKTFAMHVSGKEVYPKAAADALEADLQPLLGGRLVTRMSRHDTNPANNLQVPSQYRS